MKSATNATTTGAAYKVPAWSHMKKRSASGSPMKGSWNTVRSPQSDIRGSYKTSQGGR